jgi:hypothetical protein
MAKPRSHIGQEISPRQVRPDGPLTHPRSYGVYSLPSSAGATRRYRFGNYPVRLLELEREYGSCKLEHLFLSRSDAMAKAASLNGNEA